jgi:hypothetical protein
VNAAHTTILERTVFPVFPPNFQEKDWFEQPEKCLADSSAKSESSQIKDYRSTGHVVFILPI